MPVANSGGVVQEGPGNQARLQPQADFLRLLQRGPIPAHISGGGSLLFH